MGEPESPWCRNDHMLLRHRQNPLTVWFFVLPLFVAHPSRGTWIGNDNRTMDMAPPCSSGNPAK